jgi:hypothetical protein
MSYFFTPLWWLERRLIISFPHVQRLKWPLFITLKVDGLLHLFGPSTRLHKAISSQPTLRVYPTFFPSDSCGGHRHARCLATYKQLFLWQYLGHHIRAILFSMDLLKLHRHKTHHISNPMISHINVLGSRIELGFLARWITLWLSYRLYFSCFTPNSCKFFIHNTSLQVSTAAM